MVRNYRHVIPVYALHNNYLGGSDNVTRRPLINARSERSQWKPLSLPNFLPSDKLFSSISIPISEPILSISRGDIKYKACDGVTMTSDSYLS